MKKTTSGFTIVELLIGIVVIAILAAISIVAYTGTQNRANDSAIQSDLTNFARQIQMRHAKSGQHPQGGTTHASGASVGNATAFPGVNCRPSKQSYWISGGTNLYYCTGELLGQPAFRIEARSASGQVFRYTSTQGLRAVGHVGLNWTNSCQGFAEPHTWSYGDLGIGESPRWFAWTDG